MDCAYPACARNSCVMPLLALLLLCFPAVSATADSRFQDHRARVQEGRLQVILVEGRILEPRGSDRLLTSIEPQRLAAQGIGDLDNVWVRIDGHRLRARVMTQDTFAKITGDDASLRDLDVDVICLVDDVQGRAGLQIVGLGGGLVEWIQPHGRMRVAIEKERY